MPKSNLNYYVSDIPVGGIVDYIGTVPPPGFFFADGSSRSKTQFPTLFAHIGYTYGGSGDTFLLPDLREVVAAGLDVPGGVLNKHASAQTLGSLIGVDRVTLSISQVATHNHLEYGSVGSDPGSAWHTHSGTEERNGPYNQFRFHEGFRSQYASEDRNTNYSNAPHSHGAGTSSSNNGGLAHFNVQRVLVCQQIIAYV